MTCEHLNLRVEEYDSPPCQQTGYHDAGGRYTCECGEVFDERELAREHEVMEKCTCVYDGDVRDDGTPYVYRIPVAGCAVHAAEDQE